MMSSPNFGGRLFAVKAAPAKARLKIIVFRPGYTSLNNPARMKAQDCACNWPVMTSRPLFRGAFYVHCAMVSSRILPPDTIDDSPPPHSSYHPQPAAAGGRNGAAQLAYCR